MARTLSQMLRVQTAAGYRADMFRQGWQYLLQGGLLQVSKNEKNLHSNIAKNVKCLVLLL